MTKKKKAPSLQQVICDAAVRDIFKKHSHKVCTCRSRRIFCTKVTGKYLNDFLVLHRDVNSSSKDLLLNPRKKYMICSNLSDTIRNKSNSSSHPTTISCTSQPTATNKPKEITPTTTLSRSQRLNLRNRIPVEDASLKGIKEVKVSVFEEDFVIDLTKRRAKQKQKFTDDVLQQYYKVPFGKLTMRERRLRMAALAKSVLSACINRKEFERDTDEYMHGNKVLAIEILNLLDGMKEYIESKVKVNFNDLEEIAVVPNPEDNEGLIYELDARKKEHKVAIALLGETSKKGYRRVRKSLKSIATIPTFENVTKNRPRIVPITYPIMNPFDTVDEYQVDEFGNTVLEEVRFDEYFDPAEDDVEVALRAASRTNESVGAKISGGYKCYVELMEKKHRDMDRCIESSDDVVVIDSIDGAEHLKSKKSVTSVISFSSSMFVSNWINKKIVTAGSSLNVLTWQQLRGTESIHSMKPAVEEYFKTKKVQRDLSLEEGKKYSYYDLHDGKMLYLLTQHSQWNRKFNPFLLCTCSRGEGVRNNKIHQCKIKSHEEQIQSYNRSKRRWDLKRSTTPNYTVKNHMDWIDENNDGCSHFGIHPSLMPRDGIRFDTFHMKCSVTKRLMGSLRSFLLNQSTDVIESFATTVLRKFWNDYHLYVWKNKKNFSSFLGNEIALFVGNVSLVVEFIQNSLISTNQTRDIVQGLTLWVSVFKFLGLTYIVEGEEENYLRKIEQFQSDVEEFYDVGSRTFLSSNGTTDGNRETFYMHALRFYIPRISRETFEKHGTGVGIFNMQGFERRNKESKNCMKRFSNNKGNIVVNNMKRVWDIFEHQINAY